MKNLLTKLATLLTQLSAVALLLAMGLIGIDIAARLIANSPIFGTTDIVTYLFAIVLFSALPATFLASRHIVVDVIDMLAPRRTIKFLVCVSAVLGVTLLAIMTWQLTDPLSYMYDTGEATLNIELPRWWLGAIALTGLALSGVMEICALLRSIKQLKTSTD